MDSIRHAKFSAPRRRFVRGAVDAELREGQIQSLEVERGSSILAEVGDSVASAHGVAAQVPRARLGGGERARHRAGRLGTQHLGRHRRPQQRLLHKDVPLAEHDVHRLGEPAAGPLAHVLRVTPVVRRRRSTETALRQSASAYPEGGIVADEHPRRKTLRRVSAEP